MAPPEESTVSTTGEPAVIELNFPGCVAQDYSDVIEPCTRATEQVRRLLPAGSYGNLALHSPGLRNFQWDTYVSLSLIRMVRVARQLKRLGAPRLKVLDFGSYFGNFALLVRILGCEVEALDTYARYAPALDNEREALQQAGIVILDSTIHQDILDRLDRRYDVILCLGVIEHVPHTPRDLLLHLRAHLVEGGHLILDTPNLAYLYRREAMMRGESVYPPIEDQFDTAIPFEGHHREYTTREVHWMLRHTGFEPVVTEMFNYSIYATNRLTGLDAQRFLEMEADPEKREVMFIVARKCRS